MMAVGACGLMNPVGNLRPKPLAELCEAVWRNDLDGGQKIHQRLLEINKAVFFDTNPIPMKYMMNPWESSRKTNTACPWCGQCRTPARLDQVLPNAGLLD
ncbi:MAG: hypothetical protein CM1200mP18_22640 [Gammaproteobacteria bacterium]|nr:MAG: hypothetical protein CM1200mP18_22640 [Gammaproteobacteria bacterium]